MFLLHVFSSVIGIINIHGCIGTIDGVQGVELIDVIAQVQSQPDAESFIVDINSPGGDCDKGYEIYNYLRSIGKPLTTRISGQCMSIATIPYLAGDIRISGPIMIHNPWLSNMSGDSDELLLAAEMMRSEEDKMIDFYAEHTGNTREALDALMKSETYLTPEQALTLKFSTTSQIKPLAYKNSMSKVIESLDSLLKKYGFKEQKQEPQKKALSVTDASGATFNIEMAGDTPAVGDMVTDANGQPVSGKLDLAEMNVSLTIEAGVVTEVAPMQSQATAEQVAALQKENEELKAAYTKLENEVAEKVALFEKALSASKSTFVAPQAQASFTKKTEEPEVVSKQSMKERKQSYKKTTK